MYWVISKWQPIPGREEEWKERGLKVRDAMRKVDGIEFVDSLQTENGDVLAIVGYSSEEEYGRVVRDPNGPFERIISENRLEEVANWVSSERGASLDR